MYDAMQSHSNINDNTLIANLNRIYLLNADWPNYFHYKTD